MQSEAVTLSKWEKAKRKIENRKANEPSEKTMESLRRRVNKFRKSLKRSRIFSEGTKQDEKDSIGEACLAFIVIECLPEIEAEIVKRRAEIRSGRRKRIEAN